MENEFSICRVPQKISLAKSLSVCLRFFGVTPLRMIIMSFRARPIGRRGISDSLSVEILHSAYVSFRMTAYCNFFPAAKKLPRKVARSLSGFPAFRFSRRRGLRNSLRSNVIPNACEESYTFTRLGGDASLSLSMTFTCHSEPTPSRVLCRTHLFGHCRGAKEENELVE